MTEKTKHRTAFNNDTILSEAASWIAQLDGDNMSDADRLALREWAARSPRHTEELKRLGGMWSGLDDTIEQYLGTLTSNIFNGARADEGKPIPSFRPSFRRFFTSAFKIRPMQTYGALALVATLMLSVFIYPSSRFDTGNVEPTLVAYSVPKGEHKVVELEDGSSVHLNTDSLIEVDYTKNTRTVRLVRGEALFEVAHDEARPFLVYAGENIVRAVGTAFVVRLDDSTTSVIVTEGIVALSSLEQGGAITSAPKTIKTPLKNLAAGQSVILTASLKHSEPEVVMLSAKTMDRKLAWRGGLLLFNGEPLGEVVAEVSRYTTTTIVISDPTLRDLPIGGVFKTGEVDGLLSALKTSFNIEVEKLDGDLVYLTQASKQ